LSGSWLKVTDYIAEKNLPVFQPGVKVKARLVPGMGIKQMGYLYLRKDRQAPLCNRDVRGHEDSRRGRGTVLGAGEGRVALL
jgi:hypothetical protein